jgi:hypothetical protein
MSEEEKRLSKMEFLEWLVPLRNETQILLFRLLKLVRDPARKEVIKRKQGQEERSEINAAFQYTVGATFSLWRSIILAQDEFEPAVGLDNAEELLDRVVSFNAILFQDEKITMQWTGGYYVTNIQFRLYRLSLFSIISMSEFEEYVEKWADFSKQPNEFELKDTEFDSHQFFEDTIKCLGLIVDRLYQLTGGLY